jgi:hypothetical protein
MPTIIVEDIDAGSKSEDDWVRLRFGRVAIDVLDAVCTGCCPFVDLDDAPRVAIGNMDREDREAMTREWHLFTRGQVRAVLNALLRWRGDTSALEWARLLLTFDLARVVDRTAC